MYYFIDFIIIYKNFIDFYLRNAPPEQKRSHYFIVALNKDLKTKFNFTINGCNHTNLFSDRFRDNMILLTNIFDWYISKINSNRKYSTIHKFRILSMFSIKNTVISCLAQSYTDLRKSESKELTNTVGIHFRMSDYCSGQITCFDKLKTSEFTTSNLDGTSVQFPILSFKYYETALSTLIENDKGAKKYNIIFFYRKTFIDEGIIQLYKYIIINKFVQYIERIYCEEEYINYTDFTELSLMYTISLCDYLIISNSTFSFFVYYFKILNSNIKSTADLQSRNLSSIYVPKKMIYIRYNTALEPSIDMAPSTEIINKIKEKKVNIPDIDNISFEQFLILDIFNYILIYIITAKLCNKDKYKNFLDTLLLLIVNDKQLIEVLLDFELSTFLKKIYLEQLTITEFLNTYNTYIDNDTDTDTDADTDADAYDIYRYPLPNEYNILLIYEPHQFPLTLFINYPEIQLILHTRLLNIPFICNILNTINKISSDYYYCITDVTLEKISRDDDNIKQPDLIDFVRIMLFIIYCYITDNQMRVHLLHCDINILLFLNKFITITLNIDETILVEKKTVPKVDILPTYPKCIVSLLNIIKDSPAVTDFNKLYELLTIFFTDVSFQMNDDSNIKLKYDRLFTLKKLKSIKNAMLTINI